MFQPDENAPTVPNRPIGRNGPADLSPYDWMGEAAPLARPPEPPLVQEGQPPRWEVPPPAKPARQGMNMQGFGIGFAVALVILAIMALGLALYVAFTPASPVATTPAKAPTQTLPPNSPTYTPTATATALPSIDPTSAQALVTQFYSAINNTQYQQAYNSLSTDLKKKQTLQSFTQQWQNMTVTLTDGGTTTTPGPDKGDTVVVQYQQAPTNGGNAESVQQFLATVIVNYDANGQIAITSIATQKQETTPTPISQPSPTPTVDPGSLTPSPAPTTPVTPVITPTTKPKGPTPTPTKAPKP